MQSSVGLSTRLMSLAFTVAMGLSLAGCSSEATERKSFIDFLQTRIVDKPGLNVPRLTSQDEKNFGQYTAHYGVIRDFNGNLDSKVAAPMRDLVAKELPRTLPDLITRRAELKTMREMTATLRTSIGAEQSKADAARAALKQPEDLKVVYDKAYERTVTAPATAVKEVLPAVEDVLVSAEKLTAYLDANKDSVTVSGNNITVTDPKVLAHANVLMTDMGQKSEAIMAAQRKMATLMTGR